MSELQNILTPLETQDLLLRPFRMSDLNDFYEYAKRPEVGPKAGWKAHPSKAFSAKILQSFLKSKDVYAIVLKKENTVIGSLGLHLRPAPDIFNDFTNGKKYREIGYVLNSDHWGKGYMPQAVSAAIYHAFHHLKLDLLIIKHNEENHASRRVIEKCGFRHIGSYSHTMPFLDDQPAVSHCYILEFDSRWKAVFEPQYDELTIW